MSCPVQVPAQAPGKSLRNGKGRAQETYRCGKKSHTLFKVTYSTLRFDNSKYDDIFGLCCDHAPQYYSPQPWNTSSRTVGKWHFPIISKLRGNVAGVEIIKSGGEPDGQLLKENKRQLIISDLKRSIKRTMCQENTRSLTTEDWHQVFDESLEEWIVEGVQNS
jgi:hypothetical protein